MERWERIAGRVNAQVNQPRFTKGSLAKELGISRPALNRRLDGEVSWSYEELAQLADIFGITINELVEDGADFPAAPH